MHSVEHVINVVGDIHKQQLRGHASAMRANFAYIDTAGIVTQFSDPKAASDLLTHMTVGTLLIAIEMMNPATASPLMVCGLQLAKGRAKEMDPNKALFWLQKTPSIKTWLTGGDLLPTALDDLVSPGGDIYGAGITFAAARLGLTLEEIARYSRCSLEAIHDAIQNDVIAPLQAAYWVEDQIIQSEDLTDKMIESQMATLESGPEQGDEEEIEEVFAPFLGACVQLCYHPDHWDQWGPPAGLPFLTANAHRAHLDQLASAFNSIGLRVDTLMFEPYSYLLWLGNREDSQANRAQWSFCLTDFTETLPGAGLYRRALDSEPAVAGQ